MHTFRHRLKSALLLLGCIQFLSAGKPNVLFIAVDDLKPDISAYGAIIPTPGIDRLAEGGTTFLNAHCQQAVCAPSRASILTGRRPDVTRVWDLKTQIRDITPDILTLPQYFKQQGYHTLGVGKIFDQRSVDDGADSVSWSQPFTENWMLDYNESTGKPTAHYHNVRSRAIGAEADAAGVEGWGARNEFLHERRGWPVAECIDVPDDAYSDGAIRKYAVQELSKLAGKEQPFFLAVGFQKPHLPFVAPKKYWELIRPVHTKRASFKEHAKGSPDYAWTDFPELRSYNGIPDSGPLKPLLQQTLIHGYYACVAYIDAQIGALLDELEAQGLAGNTIVVLWGDNGWHLGDHGQWTKHTNYEQATRVPFIVKMPGQSTRSTTMPAELTDLFPTLCELAALPLPEDLDGVSLAPTVLDGQEDLRDFAVSQYPRGERMGYALRNERYRFVAWYQTGPDRAANGDEAIDAIELYDYQEDPLETENLAELAGYAETVSQLRQQLSDFLATESAKRQ